MVNDVKNEEDVRDFANSEFTRSKVKSQRPNYRMVDRASGMKAAILPSALKFKVSKNSTSPIYYPLWVG